MALESITTLANDIYFGAEAEPSSPIVYTYTYIEWEANKVNYILFTLFQILGSFYTQCAWTFT